MADSIDWEAIERSPELVGGLAATILSREGRAERSYHELHVRADTGIG